MDANLVSTSCFRNRANQSESLAVGCLSAVALAKADRSCEAFFDVEFRDRFRALRMNHLFQPDRGLLMLTLSVHRRIDNFRFPIRPAPNNCEIFLMQASRLHQQTEPPRSSRSFRNQNH